VEHLPRQSDRRFASPEERLSLEMLTAVRLLDLTGLGCREGRSQRHDWAFLDLVVTRLKEFDPADQRPLFDPGSGNASFLGDPRRPQTMKYRVIHKTAYRYSEPASLSQNELVLHPRETVSQQVVQSRLTIEPEPQYLHQRTDYFGNTAHVFMVQQPHKELVMTATSMVETTRPVLPVPDGHGPLGNRRSAAGRP
jgi:hypothetical protein